MVKLEYWLSIDYTWFHISIIVGSILIFVIEIMIIFHDTKQENKRIKKEEE